ncbi:tripartite motif-containing protein 16-like [Oncorhynchus clarkii lewisi]|uniref:tripartite motif-containing protein 16-like n=1 Tax=Oncorhynchus clarkii lewisi TaxID=490388 RepID=UPI0039B9049C
MSDPANTGNCVGDTFESDVLGGHCCLVDMDLSYQSLSSISASSDLPSIVVRPLQYFGDVSKTVSELREKLEDFLKGEWTKISTTVNIVDVVLPPEPKTREQLLQYSCQLTLDPNTAHTHLSLSEGNRKVTYTEQVQPYPCHPDRFTNQYHVLCREGLSGRCYWEVEWSGNVVTAVSYKDISRTGTDSGFGHNNKSWNLEYYRGGYWFRYNNVVTKVVFYPIRKSMIQLQREVFSPRLLSLVRSFVSTMVLNAEP